MFLDEFLDAQRTAPREPLDIIVSTSGDPVLAVNGNSSDVLCKEWRGVRRYFTKCLQERLDFNWGVSDRTSQHLAGRSSDPKAVEFNGTQQLVQPACVWGRIENTPPAKPAIVRKSKNMARLGLRAHPMDDSA